jgi:hypothetical protein
MIRFVASPAQRHRLILNRDISGADLVLDVIGTGEAPSGHVLVMIGRSANEAFLSGRHQAWQCRGQPARPGADQTERDSGRSVRKKALLQPVRPDIADGLDILWRPRDGLRIVILTHPTPNLGAMLVKTVYRIEEQASARR